MLLLSAVCALIAGLMIAVIALWSRYARSPGGLAHEKALYAGFIADVERRLWRGDIDDDQAAEERAEAGRALLKAGDAAPVASVGTAVPAIGAVVMAGLAFGLYLLIGHPSLSDMPYAARLKAWTHQAQSDPDAVPPEVMAPVLRQGAADPDKARNPDYWAFLGRIDMVAGNTYQGLKDYQKALVLSGPQAFAHWSELGEAMTLRAGATTPEARQAFETALARDPHDTRAHYYLGRQAVADGQYDAARAHFNAALADVPAGDVRHEQLEKELAAVDPAQKAGQAAKARISGMVTALSASLKADPDNADGWSRLLRSYDVLGDAAAHDAAVRQVQAHFPADQAAAIVAKSQGAVGAEDTGGQP